MEHWPYIASGLAIILVYWSRGLAHTFTLIKWPIEFGHNFLYIISTFLESIMFIQLVDPLKWHAAGVIFWASIIYLFWYDMKMIRERLGEATGASAKKLFLILEEDQKINIHIVMPLTTLFYAAATALIYYRQELFIEKGWHFYLGIAQSVALIAYLIWSVWSFKKIGPLIQAAHEE